MFAGSIELLQEGQELNMVSDIFREFVKACKDYVVDQLDIETSDYLVESI